MKLRVTGNRLLFRIGLRSVLPAEVVAGVPVLECGEPMVEIQHQDRLRLAQFPMYARVGAVERLIRAAAALPDDYLLFVVDAFRSAATQERRWADRLSELAARTPTASAAEIERRARLYTAPPSGVGSGHQTGGAFDVTLLDVTGNALDMGTEVKEASRLTPTYARGLTTAQRANRHVLSSTMGMAGFQNYPMEWWHFCVGDRMWAAYQGRSYAIYDSVLRTHDRR